MSRLHVHVSVAELDRSIEFYSGLFGAAPTVRKPDYAKWQLEEPRVNFAISERDGAPGIRHLGIQADSEAEFATIRERVEPTGETYDQGRTTCCYARSDKAWIDDPTGVSWELFHSFGTAETYGEKSSTAAAPKEKENAACCAPPAAIGATAAKRATASCC
jgi:catechol 2,3-dioxygenase-like lactoylglutathione lyase family enzyme